MLLAAPRLRPSPLTLYARGHRREVDAGVRPCAAGFVLSSDVYCSAPPSQAAAGAQEAAAPQLRAVLASQPGVGGTVEDERQWQWAVAFAMQKLQQQERQKPALSSVAAVP